MGDYVEKSSDDKGLAWAENIARLIHIAVLGEKDRMGGRVGDELANTRRCRLMYPGEKGR